LESATALPSGPYSAWQKRRGSRRHPRLGVFARFPASSKGGILVGRRDERGSGVRFRSGRFLFSRHPIRHYLRRFEYARTGDCLPDWYPAVGYRPATRPRLTRYHLLAAANRASGYALTGYLSSLVAHQREHAIAIRLKAGLVIGVVTTVVGACSPFIEWTADPAPSRRRGIFGVVLLLIGFTLQSVQYWAALPGVAVR
jgi:hypothetical protein